MDEDLDDLLNDALSDFDKPPQEVGKAKKEGTAGPDGPPSGAVANEKTPWNRSEGASEGPGLQAPKEIFEQFFDKDLSDRLQREWDSAMKELVEDDPTLTSQLQNLSTSLDTATDATQAASNGASESTPKDKEDATSSGTPAGTSSVGSSKGQHVEAVDMNSVIDAAISGIGGSADELRNMSSAEAEEKLLNEMRNMGLGDGMSGIMGNPGDLGGLEGDFMQMMEGMMGNLLSKDVLYPTMKEISKIYPQWLVDNEGKIPEGEFQRYQKQNKIIDKICKAFEEEEGENEPKEVKSQRLNVMMNLVEQMQECGNPPKDLLEKCGGGTAVDMGKFFGVPPSFDPSAFNLNDMNPPDGCNIM